jgi:hypothetical protein
VTRLSPSGNPPSPQAVPLRAPPSFEASAVR